MPLFSTLAAPFKTRPHFWLLALVLLLGAALRCFDLSSLPMGLHGDEGIVGYEARRILNEGSIGPYSPASFGQPSGPIYFSAIGVALGGDEILSIRAWSAIFGVLTIAALFFVLRASLGASFALLSAFLLATLCWHIHYSRIAFPLVAWPLMCVFIIGALHQAQIRGGARWWLGAGFLNGLGVYVYKAHPLFGLIALGIAVWILVRDRAATATRGFWLAAYGLTALLTASPMILYALGSATKYNQQFALTSIFNQAAWESLPSLPAQIYFLVARYVLWWDWMTLRPIADRSDGAGLMPMISPVLAGLALWGFFAFKRREPLIQWSRWIVVLMPVAAVVTNEGLARRTFALAPFLCVLAVVGAVEIVRWSRQFAAKRAWMRQLAPGFVGILLATHAALSWRAYFVTFGQSPTQAWIFCDELTKSLAYMRSVPPGRPIYFYSSRWSINYDTRKFLAPDLNARDASPEFSKNRQLVWPPPSDNGAVWVFVGFYKELAPELHRLFPGTKFLQGTNSIAAENNGPAFLVLEN